MYTCEITPSGVWTGALVQTPDGVIHRGSWEPIHGCFGELRTDCGLEELGYITDGDTTCPACAAAAS